MRKRIGLIALVLALIMLTGCAEQEMPTEAPELKEPVGVQSDMAVAYIGEIFDVEYYDASVKPYVEELWFEVNGTVTEINAYPGMMVEEGDIIIELDQTSMVERAETLRREIEYAEKDNAYSDAMAEIDIEMLELELRSLKESKASEKEIALKENEIRQREAALRQTKELREPDLQKKREELAEISLSLDKNVLRAPFSGRIVYGDNLTRGSWVTAYDPIVFLADDDQLRVVSEYISESKIRTASRIFAHIGAHEYDVELIPLPQEEYISMLLSDITITTEFNLTGPEEHLDELTAGQYAAVCIYTNYIEDALLVPSGAVLKDASGRYVYVDEDGQRVRRAVRIGKTTDGLTQILEGLEEGEVVYVKD